MAGSDASETRSGFYPLDIGNQWQYDHSFTIQLFPDGGLPGDPETFKAAVERRITGEIEVAGKVYRVQETSIDEPGGPVFETEYYRQTRQNLLFIEPPAAGRPFSPAVKTSAGLRWSDGASPGLDRAREDLQARIEAFHRSLAASEPAGGPGPDGSAPMSSKTDQRQLKLPADDN